MLDKWLSPENQRVVLTIVIAKLIINFLLVQVLMHVIYQQDAEITKVLERETREAVGVP